MRLSAIIPTLNEAAGITLTLQHILSNGIDDVIVADGGSQDATCRIAREMGCRVIAASPGRSVQMNAGAKLAQGDVLLFVHADTLLPRTAKEDIRDALADCRVIAGRFDVRFDLNGWFYALLAWLINWRSRLSRIATGDQAIFVRRDVFERIGGFPGIPLMEDVELSRRLKEIGRMACLRQQVVTSARRWERHGRFRTVFLMWLLRFLYFSGVGPERLKRLYADAR